MTWLCTPRDSGRCAPPHQTNRPRIWQSTHPTIWPPSSPDWCWNWVGSRRAGSGWNDSPHTTRARPDPRFAALALEVSEGFVPALDPGHHGMAGPGVAPRLNASDSISGALEKHLHSSIGEVTGPSDSPCGLGHPPVLPAKPDSLDKTRDQQSPSDQVGIILLAMRVHGRTMDRICRPTPPGHRTSRRRSTALPYPESATGRPAAGSR